MYSTATHVESKNRCRATQNSFPLPSYAVHSVQASLFFPGSGLLLDEEGPQEPPHKPLQRCDPQVGLVQEFDGHELRIGVEDDREQDHEEVDDGEDQGQVVEEAVDLLFPICGPADVHDENPGDQG